MKTGRGKRVALVTVAIGVVVLAATGYALLRERVREEHWLRQLDREDETAKKAAAEKLGVLRSAKAVPLLLRELPLLQDRSSAAIKEAWVKHVPDAGSSVVWAPAFAAYEDAVWQLNWIGQALVRIGPSTTPDILEASRGRSLEYGDWLVFTLCRVVRTWGEPTLPWLRARTIDPDPRIRDLAGAAYSLLLEHESGATRKAAVAVAQEFPTTRVRSRVRYMADRDPDGDVRVAASGAWERLRASDGPER